MDVALERVSLELDCVRASISETSVGDSFAVKLIGDRKKAEGEVVEDGKTDDNCVGGANGENGDVLGGEGQGSCDGDDYESDEDDASDQLGSDDSGKEHDENGDEEDGDEDFTAEEEEYYSGSGSDEDEDPLLDHAMEVYASDSFSLFRHEYEKCKALVADCIHESGSDFKYTVKREGEKNHPCFKVSASFVYETVDCCCNHFAVTGMLCSHALLVLKLLHIERIPDQYLFEWRMKSMDQSLMEKASLQKRRKILPSQDDCLNQHLKKKTSKEGNGQLIWQTFIHDIDNCDDTNHFGSPILKHAKQIYVSETYELFRGEYRRSEYFMASVVHKFVDWRGLVYDFEVFKPRRIDLHKVHAEAKDGTIKCSCRKFETLGILCAHALAVFSSICIVKIPHQYIVPKFLKDPNMAVDHNIHGPDYDYMLKFAVYMITRSGSSTILQHAWRGDNEESLVAMKDELREFSKNHGSKKRKASGSGSEEEEMGVKWKLYDDQLIKDFTYKKSEAKKMKLMDYTNSFFLKFS